MKAPAYLILLCLCVGPPGIKAQVSNYMFSSLAGAFTPLTGGTTLGSANDDEIFNNINIGFNFIFNGQVHDSLSICSDGFIALGNVIVDDPYVGGSGLTNNGEVISKSRTDNIISGLNLNLQAGSAPAGVLSYLTSGTSPNRVFTVDWSNYNDHQVNDAYSFQIKLFETTNIIQVVYGSFVQTAITAKSQVGLRGYGNKGFNTRSVTGGTSTWSTSGAAIKNTDYCTVSWDGTVPPSGLTYQWQLPDIDLSAAKLSSPSGCYGGKDQTVAVTISNMGNNVINFSTNPVTVNASAGGVNPTTFSPVTINSGTLNPGTSQEVIVSTTYDMSATGDYTFAASATLSGDQYADNNNMPAASRKVYSLSPAALPLQVDFSNYNGDNLSAAFPGWYEAKGTSPADTFSGWVNADDEQVLFFGTDGVTAKINLYTTSNNEWIIGPKFTATSDSRLEFKAALTIPGGTDQGKMGSDDKVEVMVSTDCGTTWASLYTFNESATPDNTLALQTVDLSVYAEQDIILGFYATDGLVDDPESYDFHIDAINITGGGVTSLKEVMLANDILIYPNPVGRNLNFQIKHPGFTPFLLELINGYGQLVYTEHLQNSSGENVNQVDVSSLPKGLYYLQVKNEDFFSGRKLLIQ